MADAVTFRVHFGDASHTDVTAATPAEARDVALTRRPKQIVIKIKRLKFMPGKKAAGRILDGRSHDEFPQVMP